MDPIRSITLRYLLDGGFDGLVGDGCSCMIDDLIHCGLPLPTCRPAVLVKGCACSEAPEPGGCMSVDGECPHRA